MNLTIERVEQTILHSETGPPGNCLIACLSMITGIPIEEIPHFLLKQSRWYPHMMQWLDEQGYYFVEAHLWDHEATELIVRQSGFPMIANGYSVRGTKHSVVLHQGEITDPHPSQVGLKSIDGLYLLIPKAVA